MTGRSVVLSVKGIVTCTQPLATQAGLQTLSKGGNCCDAAVTVAACLSVLEPSSTGPGGDLFALIYKDGIVTGLNGSGKSPGLLTLEMLLDELDKESSNIDNRPYNEKEKGAKQRDGTDSHQENELYNLPQSKTSSGKPLKISPNSVHSITVPGSVAAWIDLVRVYGSKKLTLNEVLQPAIDLARNGFPVSKISSSMWKRGEKKLFDQNQGTLSDNCGYLPAPAEGEVKKLKGLADLFEIILRDGKEAFYNGPITQAILKTTTPRGSKLTAQDFMNHSSIETTPITADFRGLTVHEHGPNSQGIIALMVLKMIEIMESRGQIPKLETLRHNSIEYVHIVVECLKLGFGDGIWFVSDPEVCDQTVTDRLLSPEYLSNRCKSITMSASTTPKIPDASPHSKSDTVMFAVTDSFGSSISVVNSLYTPFGSGIIVPKYDLLLQSRGSNFSLAPGTPNTFGPSKRPYHTIIPGIVTRGKELVYTFGNMGGFMQPQGHVQILCNLVVFGMNVQEAVDFPRFCVDLKDGKILLEIGFDLDVKAGLEHLGHLVSVAEKGVFGRAQVIERRNGVNFAGSDRRGDGHACPEL